MTVERRQFALLAGSGFESLSGTVIQDRVETRFGLPSSPLRLIKFSDREVLLIARHGDSMLIPPHEINYRANLAALADRGVSDVVALNTVGVIRRGIVPGRVVVPRQLIDYTYGRAHSIYGAESGNLHHIEFTEPFDSGLRNLLLQAAHAAQSDCHEGGVYAVTQGPRLETAAEIDRLERDGADFVGMTAMPEASIALELGMRYACLSLVVNYAAGRGDKGIHEDLAEATHVARARALGILDELFTLVQ